MIADDSRRKSPPLPCKLTDLFGGETDAQQIYSSFRKWFQRQ